MSAVTTNQVTYANPSLLNEIMKQPKLLQVEFDGRGQMMCNSEAATWQEALEISCGPLLLGVCAGF